MSSKIKERHTPEQIICKLRSVETALSQGVDLGVALSGVQISPLTYYHWKQEYGPMEPKQLKRLREVERENVRLRALVVELTFDKAALRKALDQKE